MSLKTALLSWPFLDAVRRRNGVPPLTAQVLHSGKSSSDCHAGKPKRLWIIVHDLDQKSLRNMKAHIENDFSATVKARQIEIVSFKATLVIEKNTRFCERELMAERLIRGLARLAAEQEVCRIVLLGCGDPARTLELTLSGGSLKSNSISEHVRDVLSNTVGIIFAPFSDTIDGSTSGTHGKFESILEKDVFQHGKPMVQRLYLEHTRSEAGTKNGSLRIPDDILAVVNSCFERNEPLQAPHRAKTHPPRNVPGIFRLRKAATAPDEFSPSWEPETTQANLRNRFLPDMSSPLSAMPAIIEEPHVGDRGITPRPTTHATQSSPIPLQKDERSHSILEEEKIAVVYFDKWKLPSALQWFEKARQRRSDEVSLHRHENIEISIASTLIRLGQFEGASRVLDTVSMAAGEEPSLNLRSVLAQCRSLCCTSSKARREVAQCLVTINKIYEDIPNRGPYETTQMVLNTGCLASLRLLLGNSKDADTRASNAVHECKKLLDTQKLELDILETQQRNLQSTEQQPPIQNEKHQYRQDDVHSLNPRSNVISTDTEVVAKKIVHLKGRIENTRKILLECGFRLVKTRTELGYIDVAFEKNEDILHQMRMVWGPNHVVTLRASNFHSKLLLLREDYSEAEAMCKNSLRYMTDHLGSEHYFTLDFVGTLVKIYLTQGRWKEAHEIAESLVVRNRSAIGETHPQTLESEVDLAHLLDLVGNTVTAEKFQRSVHEKCEKILGQHHPTTLISRSRLASVYFNAGRFSDAERQVRDVSEYLDSKKTTGDNHETFSVATANKIIASVARRLASRYRTEASSKEDPESRREAKEHSGELFKISEDHIGEAVKFHAGALQTDHAELLTGRFEQYLIKRDKEERVDDRLLRDLHDILMRRRPRSGSSHPEIAAMQHELSLSYASIGGWEDARRLGIAALEARLQAFDTSHPDVLRSRLQLAPILWCVGQMEEAIKQLMRAHDTIYQSPSSFPAFDLLSIKGNLANVLAEVGEDEKAAQLQEQLVDESKGKNNHLATRNDLAFIYQKSGRFDEAEHEYDEIERELDNRCSITSTKPNLFVMIVKSNRASLHMKKAEYAQAEKKKAEYVRAEKLQREVKRILKLHPAYGELNRDTITCRYNLALILKMKGEDEKAEEQLQKALENMERLAGKDHVESKDMKAKLQEWAKSSAGKKPRTHMQKALSGRHRRDSGCVAPY